MRHSVTVAMFVLVAACGSGSQTMTSAGGNGTMPGGGTGGSPLPGGASLDISIQDYSFTPSAASVKVGSTVMWTNNGTVMHTTTSDAGAWNSGQLSGSTPGGPYGGGTSGASFQFTFTAAGTYMYHCANHPTLMMGSITVTP